MEMIRMTKRITREEIINIVNRAYSQYYRLYSNEMSLAEKLFFKDIQKTIINIVYDRLEELAKELEE